MSEGNGHAGDGEQQPTDVVTIELDRATWHVHIGGHAENLHLMRSMLLHALWEVELRLRQEAAAAVIAQAKDAARTHQLLGNLKFGRHA